MRAQREIDEELYGSLENPQDSPYELLNLVEKMGATFNTAAEMILEISQNPPFKNLTLIMKMIEKS